jgi:hypothetical protein
MARLEQTKEFFKFLFLRKDQLSHVCDIIVIIDYLKQIYH